MMGTISPKLTIVSALTLLCIAATVSGQGVIVPGETYTADLIGPSTIDSNAQRHAPGGRVAHPLRWQRVGSR